MNTRATLSATCLALAATLGLAGLQGCAVKRDQSTVGEYIDDVGITARVKAKFAENKQVDASSISVETLNGTVMLSGFAKSQAEKDAAAALAADTRGVKAVKNEVAVRPPQ